MKTDVLAAVRSSLRTALLCDYDAARLASLLRSAHAALVVSDAKLRPLPNMNPDLEIAGSHEADNRP